MSKDQQTITDNLPRWITADRENSWEFGNNKGITDIARSEASLNRPESGDTRSTPAEAEIIAMGGNFVQSLNHSTGNLLQPMENEVDEFDATYDGGFKKKVFDAIKGYKDIEHNFKQEWKAFKAKYLKLKESTLKKLQQYTGETEAFRQAYNIPRQAEAASAKHWAVLAIITIVFFVIEIKINGKAVGMVSIGGKNYGALIATIIALINVYGSALVGYVVLKNMNHLDKNKHTMYKTFGLLYAAVIVYLNWAYAAFRQLSEKTMGEIMAKKLSLKVDASKIYDIMATSSSPWGIPLSIPSIGLLLLGVFFAAFTLYKFYHINDIIPGFGSVTGKRNRAQNKLDELNKAEDKELGEMKKKYTLESQGLIKGCASKLDELRDKSKNTGKRYNEIINDVQVITKFYKNQIRSAHVGMNHMLEEFRKTNEKIQKSKDSSWNRPSHWDKKAEFSPETIDPNIIFENQKSLLISDDEKKERRIKYSKGFELQYQEAMNELYQFRDDTVKDEEEMFV